MRSVYPKLAKVSREKYGLEFQVVDMRWGVPEQASNNHSTTDLCISEIQKCKKVSAGPNFVVIIHLIKLHPRFCSFISFILLGDRGKQVRIPPDSKHDSS